ncbi:MAG: hypothetical protein R2862_01570 [Thermoanaerobaculia bacterium]
MSEAKSTKAAPRKRATKSTRKAAKAPAPGSIELALAALGRRADEARVRLGTLSDESAKAAGKSLDKATRATKAKVNDLNKKWQKLEPKRKAQWIAGVLGAIAAAAAIPIVAKERRKAKAAKAGKPAAKS